MRNRARLTRATVRGRFRCLDEDACDDAFDTANFPAMMLAAARVDE